MGDRLDETKGVIKEETGRVTSDPELEHEGKLEQAKASVKRGIEEAGEKLSEGVDKAQEKLREMRK